MSPVRTNPGSRRYWNDLNFWHTPVWEEIQKKIEEVPENRLCPPPNQVLKALALTPFEKVKVVILGQDPYYAPNVADGLAFSINRHHPDGTSIGKYPPALANIFRELQKDYLPFEWPQHGNLNHWAGQGVLLINTILTTELGKPLAHAKWGWQNLIRDMLYMLGKCKPNVVYILWGEHAKSFRQYLPTDAYILEGAHPSSQTASKFFGCGHFSRANSILRQKGLSPIDWRVPK